MNKIDLLLFCRISTLQHPGGRDVSSIKYGMVSLFLEKIFTKGIEPFPLDVLLIFQK